MSEIFGVIVVFKIIVCIEILWYYVVKEVKLCYD